MGSVENIRDTINGYERLLRIIEEHEDGNKICNLSKKELTKLYGLSYTGTCKKLGFLLKYGLVTQVEGGFLRTGKKIVQDTPLSLLSKILQLMINKPLLNDDFH